MGDLMQASPGATTLDPSDLAAIPCPLDRAAAACRLARAIGTLPPAIARIRQRAIVELLQSSTVTDVAKALRLTGPRISQLRAAPAADSSDVSTFGSFRPDDDMPTGEPRPRLDRSSMEA